MYLLKPFANDAWFVPWTRRTVLWVCLALILMFVLEFPFVFFFDTSLTNVGFTFIYFWALPQALILYFIAFKLHARWLATALLGLVGVIGIPVEYYFEWIVQQNLLSPIFAFAYALLFILMGLAADVSLMALHPGQGSGRAALISSFIFTVVTLLLILFATLFFYPLPPNLSALIQGTWLRFGYFLIPYALVTGTLGGYLGFALARDVNLKRPA